MDAAHPNTQLPEDADFSISEEDQSRLWLAYHATTLLAALTNDIAIEAGINHDGPAAVAEYIRHELLDVLSSAQRLREPDPSIPPSGADLI
ncbi:MULTISPECIES: hypothetical protein [Xanthomonas]|uniref:Uncharacterized protein n=3 Tax=Xanthomonas TaxID=338 RepID=A0ABN7N5A3_9XANT|nr:MULTISPECIES: hypothetical protein [Xanthomonas]ARV24885.1 hypothetical protein A9D66_20320 [Xanthomonas citri pv. glycines str. 12-2]OEY89269.1 hypothetical protein BIY41_19525 [Xanthomonas citri pv. glycines]OOX00340.1 hypothetical protein Xgly_19700 [Xanthomonas citri pv. glycines]QDS21887.1 hypothetical protein FPL05_21140 [Xanthomonas citri pv. glycines]QEQ75165.1 hypothetical protein C2859_21085 [Xanthomonas citri pv. glycines]